MLVNAIGPVIGVFYEIYGLDLCGDAPGLLCSPPPEGVEEQEIGGIFLKTTEPPSEGWGEKALLGGMIMEQQRTINGGSTEQQRTINGGSTEDQRRINGGSTEVERTYNVVMAEENYNYILDF